MEPVMFLQNVVICLQDYNPQDHNIYVLMFILTVQFLNIYTFTPVLILLQNTVTCEHEQATGPKKLKTDDSQNTDEVTILNIPLPVACPLEQEVNVKDVGCGSRHTIVLLGEQLRSSSIC